MSERRLGVAIVAGGAGERLRAVSKPLPKALAPFDGATLLDHQLEQAASLRPERVIVLACAGRGSGAIQRHVGGRAQVLVEQTPLGTAGGLAHLPAGPDTWLVRNVDHVSDVDMKDLLSRARGPCTALVTTVDVPIDEGVVTLDSDSSDLPFIRDWQERPLVQVQVTTGLYVFRAAALQPALDGSPVDMPDLVRALMPDGVRAVVHRGAWFDAGTPARLARAEAWWREVSAP